MRKCLLASAIAVAAACSNQPGAPSPASAVSSDHGYTQTTEVLVGAGDIGRCGSAGPEATARLLDRLPGTVFTAGDNAYPNGSEQDYRDCYAPSWGRHRSRTRPTPGNHEYATPGAEGYFAYFGGRAGDDQRGYYAYTLGAWRILALNSEAPVSAGSPQAVWAKAELAAAGTSCTAAYWHRPLMSSGPHGDNADMRDLFQILYDAGVEFVVGGHDPLYERVERVDPHGRSDAARGVRQFVVGTGGTAAYLPARSRRGSEVQGTDWGVIRFDLAPGSYRWQFIPVEGASFQDSGFEACH
jgi:hypothetical protein